MKYLTYETKLIFAYVVATAVFLGMFSFFNFFTLLAMLLTGVWTISTIVIPKIIEWAFAKLGIVDDTEQE